MPSVLDKLKQAGLDKKQIDGWVDEPIFVGKEKIAFVVKSDDKTKVIKNG